MDRSIHSLIVSIRAATEMGRGKLALELIPKEKSRLLTFEKRKKGLMKKAGEFSTLCGVDTCMIIFGERGTEPEVWPPEKDEVRRIIDRYLSEGPDRRSKRTVGLPDFFFNRKKKLDAELKKVRTANWEAKYPVSDEIVEGLSEEQLRSFLDALKGKLDVAKELLGAMKEKLQEDAAGNEMVPYDFYAKDNGLYSDHTMQCPSTFVDVKPGFEFPNGYCHDQHLLQPMPDPTAMYSPFSNEVMAFGAQGNIPYTMVHNDAGPSMLNGFGDHSYPPMPQNFQFPPVHGMPFHEPTFSIPSNMAFSGNVGHCEAMPMQQQMMSGMHFSMVPTDQPNVGMSQASSSMPFSGFPDMLIKGKGKGIS